MSIEVIASDGLFIDPARKIDNLDEVNKIIRERMKYLFNLPVESILELLHRFSRALVREPSVKRIPGIAFLSNWLRRENLRRIVEINLGNLHFLDDFMGEGRKQFRAFPRGVVCHWIAGNIPTLSLFSLFQSMICKNGNILRIPEISLPSVLPILRLFSTMEYLGITGVQLLKSVAVVFFPSDDVQSNEQLSMMADARVVWGGKEAVSAISNLPHMTHCEDIIFGPKYSFSVFDKKVLVSESLGKYIRNLASDIVLFEQTACSSPHVVFLESDWNEVMGFGELLAKEFQRLSRSMPKEDVDVGMCINIINKRAEYALDKNRAVICPKENDWSILIDSQLSLEEPIQSRTIFLKPVANIMDVASLVTRNVQSIGNGILDDQKATEFANEAMCNGAARIVPPGQMHIYDSPWDGILLLSRLVRWNTLSHLE